MDISPENMNNLLLKEKMQHVITQSMNLTPQAVYHSLSVYQKSFGSDDFFCNSALSFSLQGPLVSLICLNCSDKEVDEFLSRQPYSNLEIVRTTANDSFEDITQYISTTKSKYLCFYEPNHFYDSSKIFHMVYTLEQSPSIDILITARQFIDSIGTVIAPSELLYPDIDKNTAINGTLLLQYSINEHKNFFGNLSTLMATTKHAKNISLDMPNSEINTTNSLSFLFHLLLGGRIHMLDNPLVFTLLQPYEEDAHSQKAYEELAISFTTKHSIVISPVWKKETSPCIPQFFPEITFFYSDMGEYYNIEPIAREAEKRGYKTIFTQNLKQKAEIGIYCQHMCYPENSKFSVILLHDMTQGHNRWPNIWCAEHWDKFDIGVLPGKLWSSLWSQCACQYYANPRYGTYELGYPKSDLADSTALQQRMQELRDELNLKYDFSILYAPSWENDEKEDDFICALATLGVNLLIKQAHWSDSYSHIIENIKQMRAIHENKYDNVYYIEPEENIMTALKLCDVVVSDESSVMVEALMFHKPSIAVTDWLIPDTTPSRHAVMPLDCVIKCKKSELREYIEKLFTDSSYYHSILQKGRQFFSNQGHVCQDIMDAIEYFTNKKTDDSFLSKRLTSKYAACSLWN